MFSTTEGKSSMKKFISKNSKALKNSFKFVCIYTLLFAVFTYFNFDEKFIKYYMTFYLTILIVFSLYVFYKSK